MAQWRCWSSVVRSQRASAGVASRFDPAPAIDGGAVATRVAAGRPVHDAWICAQDLFSKLALPREQSKRFNFANFVVNADVPDGGG